MRGPIDPSKKTLTLTAQVWTYDLQGQKKEIEKLETEIEGVLQDLISAEADEDLVGRGDTPKGTLETLNIEVTQIVGEKERKKKKGKKKKKRKKEKKKKRKKKEKKRKKKEEKEKKNNKET